MSDAHTMWLTAIDENTGEEIWECPCGRVVKIKWPPWEKRVITPGDETAQHLFPKGGLVIDMPRVSNACL